MEPGNQEIEFAIYVKHISLSSGSDLNAIKTFVSIYWKSFHSTPTPTATNGTHTHTGANKIGYLNGNIDVAIISA